MALGVRWGAIDITRADGLYARRNRLAESSTDMAADERRLTRKKSDSARFLVSQIDRIMILSMPWMGLATVFRMTSRR